VFVGIQDDFSNVIDNFKIKDKVQTIEIYKEYDQMDHYSFGLGKKMDYINDVISFMIDTN
jgi:CO dehydrogenase/acetyl-CoA synthase epsilon subunit